ncbi:MAG: MmcQ/YjbR family DNA-binding protein [Rhodobacteraceae bacterium]|nr:MmcQ/YjbR family DNA-binding protein [Paracoccaceae bacterium]
MTGDELRVMALALPGTVEYPHFDRVAFKVRRTYATLAPDGASVNLNLSPEEQTHYADLFPDTFAPVANAWGARGWTRVDLAAASAPSLDGALRAAWTRGSAQRP